MANSQSATSIDLTWAPELGEVVMSYKVTFSYQGPCSGFTDSDNITVESASQSHTLTGRQEFSSYTVSVTALNDGGRSTSQTRTVTTMSAGKIDAFRFQVLYPNPTLLVSIVQKTYSDTHMIADHYMLVWPHIPAALLLLMLFKVPEYLIKLA